MATATRQTSLDKVLVTAEQFGWTADLSEVEVTIKDPDPGNGVGYGRRRTYVPRIQVQATRVELNNGVEGNDPGGYGGPLRVVVFFDKAGKYLAEKSTSTGYHVYGGKPLRDVLNVLDRMAGDKIRAHKAERAAQDAAAKAKQIAQAEENIVNAQIDLDRATVAARTALAEVGVCDDDMDKALASLQGPLFTYGLCAERRKEADSQLAGILRKY